jgi:hypothetical protein
VRLLDTANGRSRRTGSAWIPSYSATHWQSNDRTISLDSATWQKRKKALTFRNEDNMATKTEQFDIFSERFRLLRWDFNQGNKTVDQIHASLLQDCRELINTPPVEESEE